ncbi:MAG: DUF1616 domain-containing protein [Desulfurococcaceae archaeon]
MKSSVLENLVKEKNPFKKLNEVLNLYNKWVNGELVIEDPEPPKSFPEYLLRMDYSLWLYAALAITFITILLVYLTNYVVALTPLRYVLGSIYVLFIPGYSLVEALYPREEDLSPLERTALSIGLSLAVVPLIGLILNYTPWGIRLLPIVTSTTVFTTAMLVIAAYRKYNLLAKSIITR